MMEIRRRRGRGYVVFLALGLAFTMLPANSASAEPGDSSTVTIAPAQPLIDAPASGKAAIGQLGDQLPIAAKRNDMRPAKLKELLTQDRTAWIDTEGRLFYIDPLPKSASKNSPMTALAAPLSETFALHSNPGANRTILLDFDGSQVAGTAWNDQYAITAGAHPAWDPAGNGPAFTDEEKSKVQQVWAMVAEDYAPFDVDVTTEDTGDATITRESTSDSVYGTRVLISPSDDPFMKICSRQCGGVAYISVFAETGGYYQPAWVFPQALSDDAKNIAEASSHEAGHNLGLQHDGTSTVGYYGGHGVWAPIMGVGYDRPLVQWSAGAYPGANNQQDDMATLRGYLGSRPDEASGSPATPSPLPTGRAYIGTRGDIDAYLLGECTAGSTIEVSPAAVAPNLDVRLDLFDGQGNLRASSAPSSVFNNRVTAGGLGASVTIPSTSDGWTITVDGVGQGSWLGGYDDYASVGMYTVGANGCDGQATTGAPSAPNDLATDPAGSTDVTMRWSAPTDMGDSPITGYIVSRSGNATWVTLAADARSHTFTGLAPDTTYQFSIRALNSMGSGPTVMTSATTTPPPPAAPSAPRNLYGFYNQTTGQINAYWTEPASSGSHPIGGYVIYLDGSYLGILGPENRGVTITRTGGFAEGEYQVGIAASNAVGSSPTALTTIIVDHPDRPTNDDFANAQVISGLSGSVDGDNTFATREDLDPAPPSNYAAGGFSTWYSWTPSDLGPVVMNTSGGDSSRDTTLAVYTGEPGTLTQVAGDDDSGPGYHAKVGFEGQVGVRYLIVVDGFNSAGGSGPFQLGWAQTIPSTPDAPTNVRATPRDGASEVRWDAPADNGSAITNYTVTSIPGAKTCTTTGALTCTVDGLTNGVDYAFTVRASNAIGDSVPSEPSDPVTPRPPAVSPGPPTNVIARAGTNQASVEWFGPLYDGGAPLTGYTVTSQPGGKSCSTWVMPIDWLETTCTVEGLTNGQEYTFSVTATNEAGTSVASAPSNPVVPRVDSAPPILADAAVSPARVSSLGGNVTVTLRVTDDISGFSGSPTILFTHPDQPSVGFSSVGRISGDQWDGTYQRVVSFPPGTAPGDWTLLVYPLNDNAGNGTFFVDGPSVTVGTPSAPTTPTLTPQLESRTVQIDWSAPDDGGNPINLYEVEFIPTGQRFTTAQTTYTHALASWPADDPARYRVRAHNPNGWSTWSDPSDDVVVPALSPDKPVTPTAVRGDKTAVIAWTATPNNGALITNYTVTSSPGAKTCTTTEELTCAVDGLTNGTSYTFTVTATNTIGDSPESEPSEAVTPAGVPKRPSAPAAKRGSTTARVTWAPANANGSAITKYVVTASPGGRTCTVRRAQSCTVKKLTNGTRYVFSVKAFNRVGGSVPSRNSPAIVPAGKPLSPVLASAVSGTAGSPIDATALWKAAGSNGAAIKGYLVRAYSVSSAGSLKLAKTSTLRKASNRRYVMPLTSGRYRFRVVATNAVGVGKPSALSNIVIAR